MAVSPAVGMAQGTALRPRLGAAGRHVPPRPFLLVPGFPCRRIRNPQKRLQMRKLLFLLPLVLAGLIIAADPIPSQPEAFEVRGGGCVDYGGQLECFCPFDSSCNETPTPTGSIVTQTIPPPTVTQAAPCNRGLGNGAEGCDPGNSGGRPGAAGEAHE